MQVFEAVEFCVFMSWATLLIRIKHMKQIFIIILMIYLFCSCNSNRKQEEKIITINPNEIRVGEIVHDSLNSDQIEKIKEIQSTFSEVYSVGLEETITNFKRDANPDKEITIWLNMAQSYKNYLSSQKAKLDVKRKKEIFKLILSRSMMPVDEAIKNSNLSILKNKEALEVLSFYSDIPKSIQVIQK